MGESGRDLVATKPVTALSDIGGYRVLGEIGKGGMGVIYLAMDPSLDRKVVIKVLHPYLAGDPVFLQRFVQEANHAATVDHPSVIRIFKVDQSSQPPFIVMEYFDGEPLDRLVAQQGPLGNAMGLLVARNIALGLREAARHGLVHRDVKPSNILVDRDGFVKLVDFGIAKSIHRDLKLTEVGEILGTPYFMAPETLKGGTVDFRSDMYALGVTLFYSFTGRYPYEGRNVAELAVRQHTGDRPNPLAIVPTITPACSQLISRLMEIAPENRYADYDNLIDAIDNARAELDRSTASRSRGLRAVMAAAASLCGLALAIAGYYFLFRGHAPTGSTPPPESSATAPSSPPAATPGGPPQASAMPVSPQPKNEETPKIELPDMTSSELPARLDYDFSDSASMRDWFSLSPGPARRDGQGAQWTVAGGRLVSTPQSRFILRKIIKGDAKIDIDFELPEGQAGPLALHLFVIPSRRGGYVFHLGRSATRIARAGDRLQEPVAASESGGTAPARRLVQITADGQRLRIIEAGTIAAEFEDAEFREGDLSLSAPVGTVLVHRLTVRATEVKSASPPALPAAKPQKRPDRFQPPRRTPGQPGGTTDGHV